MGDTQADLTERARRLTQKLAKHFIGEQFAAEDETCRQCVAMVSAALQSEREAAAAEARRALAGLLLLADKAKAMAHRSPGYVGVSMAVDELHNAIAALASPPRWPALGSSLPPAPQEDGN